MTIIEQYHAAKRTHPKMGMVPDHVAQKLLGLRFGEGRDLLGVLDVIQVRLGELPGPVEPPQVWLVRWIEAEGYQLLSDFVAFFGSYWLDALGAGSGLVEDEVDLADWLGVFLQPPMALEKLFFRALIPGNCWPLKVRRQTWFDYFIYHGTN